MTTQNRSKYPNKFYERHNLLSFHDLAEFNHNAPKLIIAEVARQEIGKIESEVARHLAVQKISVEFGQGSVGFVQAELIIKLGEEQC